VGRWQWRNDRVAAASIVTGAPVVGAPDKERKGQRGPRPEKVTGGPEWLHYATGRCSGVGISCLSVRIISTAVKCFDDVKMNVRQRCRHEGAEIYHVHYIQPLVERTRDTVLTRCTLSAPYSAYFLQVSGSSSTLFVSRPCLIVSLVVFYLRLSSSISVAVSAWRRRLINLQYPISVNDLCVCVQNEFSRTEMKFYSLNFFFETQPQGARV